MELNQQKEQFSIAYVHAVASVAGFQCQPVVVDDDSIDLTISASGNSGYIRRPRIDIQLKCTARDILKDDVLSFPLDVRAYDNLREPDLVCPRILIVVVVPDKCSDWIDHDESALVLKHCGYWCSLREKPPTSNSQTVTVDLPRTQVFSPSELRAIMDKINAREPL